MSEANKINIITSLYRSERDLKAYCENVASLDLALYSADIQLELVIVANDASDFERECLEALKSRSFKAITIKLIYVPRESIYASWNRGIAASTAPYISFWGVDDIRYAEAIVDGIKLLQQGYDIVYLPYQLVTFVNWGIVKIKNHTTPDLPPFDKEKFAQKMRLGPFWIGSRAIFEKVGLFDENFLVGGDYDWAIRALSLARFVPSKVLAGIFVASGDNLSGNNNLRKFVEDNVIRLRYGMSKQLVPVEPEEMRRAWTSWGKRATDPDLSPEIEEFLWGAGAEDRHKAWRQDFVNKQRKEQLRRIPRMIINRLGLRPLFRFLKLVKS